MRLTLLGLCLVSVGCIDVHGLNDIVQNHGQVSDSEGGSSTSMPTTWTTFAETDVTTTSTTGSEGGGD
ncbi:MAG: hypothetical protein ACPG77_07850, partial [Nannocystaceae bacterium]